MSQQIFDTIVEHLRKQGCKSIANSRCVYRGWGNTKCAAGILIPDSDYSPSMEGFLVRNCPFFKERYGEDELELISKLQRVHDRTEICDWEKGFQAVAVSFNLVYKEPVNEN